MAWGAADRRLRYFAFSGEGPDGESVISVVDLATFAAETLITIQEGTMSHQVLVAAFQRAGLSLVPDMSFDNFQLIVDLVAAGMGVGVASMHVAEPMLKRGELQQVSVQGIDGLKRSIGLAVHAERVIDGALAAFCDEFGTTDAGD